MLKVSDDGKMKLGGFVANVYSNAGSALDLSGPVMDRALFHIDAIPFLQHIYFSIFHN